MTEGSKDMNAERFQELADAYGGDIRRWPQTEQAGAWERLETDPAAAMALVEAGRLDALLGADAPMAVSGVLRERIMARAPKRPSGFGRAGAWMTGAGLAAACAAGVVMGASFYEPVFTDPAADTIGQAATAFDGGVWFEGLEAEG